MTTLDSTTSQHDDALAAPTSPAADPGTTRGRDDSHDSHDAPTLTPLGLAALALLEEGANHPYELYQTMLRRGEDRVVKVSAGTLYHAVKRLAVDGLVEVVGTDRGGNRPERTTYRLTTSGTAALHHNVERIVARPRYEYPTLPLALGELHHLGQQRAITAVRDRLAALDEEVEISDAVALWLREVRRLPRRYHLDHDYQRTLWRAERDWLGSLLADLETGRLELDGPDCDPDNDGEISGSYSAGRSPLFLHLPDRKV